MSGSDCEDAEYGMSRHHSDAIGRARQREHALLRDGVEVDVDYLALQVAAVEVNPEVVPVLAVEPAERTLGNSRFHGVNG